MARLPAGLFTPSLRGVVAALLEGDDDHPVARLADAIGR